MPVVALDPPRPHLLQEVYLGRLSSANRALLDTLLHEIRHVPTDQHRQETCGLSEGEVNNLLGIREDYTFMLWSRTIERLNQVHQQAHGSIKIRQAIMYGYISIVETVLSQPRFVKRMYDIRIDASMIRVVKPITNLLMEFCEENIEARKHLKLDVFRRIKQLRGLIAKHPPIVGLDELSAWIVSLESKDKCLCGTKKTGAIHPIWDSAGGSSEYRSLFGTRCICELSGEQLMDLALCETLDVPAKITEILVEMGQLPKPKNNRITKRPLSELEPLERSQSRAPPLRDLSTNQPQSASSTTSTSTQSLLATNLFTSHNPLGLCHIDSCGAPTLDNELWLLCELLSPAVCIGIPPNHSKQHPQWEAVLGVTVDQKREAVKKCFNRIINTVEDDKLQYGKIGMDALISAMVILVQSRVENLRKLLLNDDNFLRYVGFMFEEMVWAFPKGYRKKAKVLLENSRRIRILQKMWPGAQSLLEFLLM